MSVLLRRFFSKEPHKRLPISKTISKNFLDKFLDRTMPDGINVFGGSNIKNAENPCKHWGFSFFYRLLSSRKIRHFPTGYCALKTVCPLGTWVRIPHPPPSFSKNRKFYLRFFPFVERICRKVFGSFSLWFMEEKYIRFGDSDAEHSRTEMFFQPIGFGRIL